jgi:hypothetical protein
LQVGGGIGRNTARQLAPEPVVGPVGHVLVGIDLEVVAAAGPRAHGAEGEAALVVAVDQLGIDRRRIGEDAEPSERIDPLEGVEHLRRDGLAAHAVEAVAPGNEIARDLVRLPALAVAQPRPLASDPVEAHILSLVDNLGAGGGMGVHQVLLHLGLAVDADDLAGQALQVDAVAPAVEGHLQAIMDQPLAQ